MLHVLQAAPAFSAGSCHLTHVYAEGHFDSWKHDRNSVGLVRPLRRRGLQRFHRAENAWSPAKVLVFGELTAPMVSGALAGLRSKLDELSFMLIMLLSGSMQGTVQL